MGAQMKQLRQTHTYFKDKRRLLILFDILSIQTVEYHPVSFTFSSTLWENQGISFRKSSWHQVTSEEATTTKLCEAVFFSS